MNDFHQACITITINANCQLRKFHIDTKNGKILGVLLFGGLDTFGVQDIVTLLQDAGCK